MQISPLVFFFAFRIQSSENIGAFEKYRFIYLRNYRSIRCAVSMDNFSVFHVPVGNLLLFFFSYVVANVVCVFKLHFRAMRIFIFIQLCLCFPEGFPIKNQTNFVWTN